MPLPPTPKYATDGMHTSLMQNQAIETHTASHRYNRTELNFLTVQF